MFHGSPWEPHVTSHPAPRTDNPLLEGLRFAGRQDSCILVIFGASGDLTKRKLFPALYSLAYRGLLPEHFAVVGVSRSEETDDEFRTDGGRGAGALARSFP